MADPVVLARLKRRLEEVWMATPKTEASDVWGTLAEAALSEATRTVAVSVAPLPTAYFLVCAKPPRADGVRVLAQCETASAALLVAEATLREQGCGELMVLEVKRILRAQ